MSAPPALPLFVFGTLRDPLVLGLVLARDAASVPVRRASLHGHVTVTLPGESYPVLAPRRDARAPGLLLDGLDAEDMARIAFFEGDEYAFEEATVVAYDAGEVSALLCAERSRRAGARPPWRLETWQRDHRADFLPAARSYMALYGRMSVAEADARWPSFAGGAGEG